MGDAGWETRALANQIYMFNTHMHMYASLHAHITVQIHHCIIHIARITSLCGSGHALESPATHADAQIYKIMDTVTEYRNTYMVAPRKCLISLFRRGGAQDMSMTK
mmetsp:Transcript_52110/g.84193  ORF Transcript_52110/g.84193 Transcript_52110/m.84193 type:complete len:106 (+) Transcript_52110:354-671(+)